MTAVHSTPTQQQQTVAVIGAGLVGSLCASMLSSRGYAVTLYEARPDPRLAPPSSRARSINLALSPRGIEALRSVSPALADRVVGEGVRMRGRMVHKLVKEGEKVGEGQDYGVYEEGEYISSISRSLLSIYLLDHLDTLNGSVTVHFGYKMASMDMRSKDGGVDMVFNVAGEEEQRRHKVDWVVGGDGAYSKVRQEMMRGTRFNFSQSYAKHAYLELTIPTGPGDTWSIESEYLHIWPRGEFMLIALPNQDKSFTVTLFAYDSTFESIAASLAALKPGETNPVIELFRKEFPDALKLMGEDGLMKAWTENPKDGLITIECSPYHYQDKALLIGDAAHAMVPFYGQGMNCAFEDVRVLSTILDFYHASPSAPATTSLSLPYSATNPDLSGLTFEAGLSPLGKALEAYSVIRAPSLAAIQKLAEMNYAEMASSVLSPLYLLRLSLDLVLSKSFTLLQSLSTKAPEPKSGGKGGAWESLYRMVTFRHGLAYEEALRRRAVQGKVLEFLGAGVGLGIAGAVAFGLTRGVRHVGGFRHLLHVAQRMIKA